ncbi:hypothetical protein ACWDUD_15395 [Rhodococcus sp. NPDC003382]|uniref:hypothetical protein n=1 Tax=unclassified Rhodococcus (in: high G+C Gram-positive bacteria) TaxID=192944 RepID=UPI0018CDF997|nr:MULTISPECIES: hypothetical protein [unclassified Rhodococcus (in: high G+C Gram-positive bacteria)]MBH0118202.1 hypothetical protein [Rhodococcus sp. CX]MCK8674381.1 hypothetical protein [Rhodococcus sp. HM1]
MESLSDLFSAGTAPWWAAPVALVVGVVLGVVAARGGRKATRQPAPAPVLRATDRALHVRFLQVADNVHNHLFELDRSELADVELDEALQSEDPRLRAIARGIVDLDAIVNEMRLTAPDPVLAAAESAFAFLTAASSDGIDDQDGFRDRYVTEKRRFVDAVRSTHPPATARP